MNRIWKIWKEKNFGFTARLNRAEGDIAPVCRLVLLVFILSLIPLLMMAAYNHSCADDYTYGLLAHTEWNRSRSLPAALAEAVKQVRISYMSWQGTFSAVFLMALQPGIFGENLYFLSTYIMLGALISGTFYFCRIVFLHYLGADKETYRMITAVILLLSIHLLPAPVQGLYWYNGSVFYVFFHGLMLFFLGGLLKMLKEPSRKGKWLRIGILAFLGFFLGGGNYVTALLLIEIEALIVIGCCFRRRDRLERGLIPFIASLTGFFISVIAPGNENRQSRFLHSRMGSVEAIRYSFVESFEWINEWTTVFVILGILFLIPLIWRCVSKSACSWKKPLLPIGLSYCLFASTFTPTLYAMGGEGAGRVQNIRYMLFILLLVFQLTWGLGWLSKIVPGGGKTEFCKCKSLSIYFASVAFACAFAAVNVKSFHQIAALSAIRSLTNREAGIYEEEIGRRLQTLNSGESEVELEPFTVKPYLLYFDDIEEDPADWKNVAVAEWFGKKKVIKRGGNGQ